MKVINLASGSKGNCTLIELGNKNIMIDMGLPMSNLKERLEKDLPKIDILIITHIHVDHIKGLKSIIREQNPDIYTLEETLSEKVVSNKIHVQNTFESDDLFIELFELSHDVKCSGVYIKYKEEELVYITDTGYVRDKLLNKYKNKDIYILESNYDEEMLRHGKYPYHLQQRILSSKGHISNDDSCRYLKTLIGEKTKCIMLAHLSEENNTREIVDEKTNKVLEKIEYKPKKVILNQHNKTEVKI